MDNKSYSRESNITVGGCVFISKANLVAWVKDLLRPGKIPYKLSGEDEIIISDLVNYHPKVKDKIGVGIKEIWVMGNGSLRAGNCFVIVRLDGSKCDFSYKYCIGGNLPNHGQRVREAMRNHVRPYIMKYKEKYFLRHKGKDGCVQCDLSYKKSCPARLM